MFQPIGPNFRRSFQGSKKSRVLLPKSNGILATSCDFFLNVLTNSMEETEAKDQARGLRASHNLIASYHHISSSSPARWHEIPWDLHPILQQGRELFRGHAGEPQALTNALQLWRMDKWHSNTRFPPLSLAFAMLAFGPAK